MIDDIKKDAQTRMAKCVQTFQTDMKKAGVPVARIPAWSKI